MTPLFTTEHEVFPLLLDGGIWLLAGVLLGAFHFVTLRTSAWMLATGSSLRAALALQSIRFAIIACALALIARHGALPLLAATLGILTSRAAVITLGARP